MEGYTKQPNKWDNTHLTPIGPLFEGPSHSGIVSWYFRNRRLCFWRWLGCGRVVRCSGQYGIGTSWPCLQPVDVAVDVWVLGEIHLWRHHRQVDEERANRNVSNAELPALQIFPISQDLVQGGQ
eukprot:GHRR01004179.1.p1 GENE.GHRR01004179.1~~GHRR01004179.1.p1  ORF type:complete len:124 (-),score=2.41 GHRR01004179.1:1230-1601(-)